jgi:hypothetical protein
MTEQIYMPPTVPGWTASVIRNNAIVTASAPITNNAGTAPRITACQMRIKALPEQVGMLVQLKSSVEIKTENAYNTLASGMIRITRDGQFIVPADPLADEGILARPMGWNIISPGSHYRIDHKLVDFVIPDTSTYYFTHVLWGASTAYAGNPATERIYVQYVEQYATVWTPKPGTLVDAPPDDPRFAELAGGMTGLSDEHALLLARVEALETALAGVGDPG